jgi:predicted phage terminase large subunit-like protein
VRKKLNLTEGQYDQQVDELKKWIRESVSPFENDTPAKKKARKDRGLTDLLFFFQTYLPHYFSCEFGECHPEWQEVTELEDCFAVVGAPREMAKSTFFTLGNPVHKIVYALKHFIWPCSDTHDQAAGFSLQIKLELEENPRIRHDFGNLKTKNWSDDEFETSNGVKVMARGRGDKVRGIRHRQHRPDMAIFDDMENDETVESPRITKKILNWMRGAVLGSLGKGYSAIMVGNLFHPLSAICQLIADVDDDGNKRYLSRVYAIILDEGTPEERSLWPANWPMSRILQKKHDVGTYTFNKEYRNKVGTEDTPFPDAQVKYHGRIEMMNRKLIFCTAIDPSATATSGSDFRAVITYGFDPKDMLFPCMHAWIKRRSINEMLAAAYQQNDQYPGVVAIEDNMLKDFLHQAIHQYAKDVGRYLPWAPMQHSTNKIGRIVGTCSYLWEHGKMLFEKGQSDQATLIEQFVYIYNQTVHDDGPDAAEMAISKLMGGMGIKTTDCLPAFTECTA